jgi:hypothetical protein
MDRLEAMSMFLTAVEKGSLSAADGWSQPSLEDIPRGLREIVNARLSRKVKFEMNGRPARKKPPEETLRRLLFVVSLKALMPSKAFMPSSPP